MNIRWSTLALALLCLEPVAFAIDSKEPTTPNPEPSPPAFVSDHSGFLFAVGGSAEFFPSGMLENFKEGRGAGRLLGFMPLPLLFCEAGFRVNQFGIYVRASSILAMSRLTLDATWRVKRFEQWDLHLRPSYGAEVDLVQFSTTYGLGIELAQRNSIRNQLFFFCGPELWKANTGRHDGNYNIFVVTLSGGIRI